MDDNQRQQFRDALDKKEQQDEERAQESAVEASATANEEQLIDTDQPQDATSVRAKNSGHGKKTADKWNQ
ncbi:MAG: hypothetical protein ACJ76Z_10105 [Thermoleophilaceae bacterium]